MCGAMTLAKSALDQFLSKMEAERAFDMDWTDHYNIRPTQLSPVLIEEDGRKKVELMKFGLIPSWARSEKMEFPTFNARSETVHQLASYREPFKNRRALVLVDGFYEFLPIDENGKVVKQPYYFKLKSGEPFLLAAVYDVNTKIGPNPIKSFSVITTPANEVVGEIHPRMPAILDYDEALIWLDKASVDSENLKSLLKPYPNDEIQKQRVARLVNNSRSEGPELISPV